MKNLFKILFTLFIITLVSCADSASDVGKVDINNGPIKIIINNKTDMEIKQVYYQQTSDFSSQNGYGTELLTQAPLAKDSQLVICPDFMEQEQQSIPYYFTFKRQKGSTDSFFYITMETPIYLSATSGIVNIDLLPYNFYYTAKTNEETVCGDGNQDGE